MRANRAASKTPLGLLGLLLQHPLLLRDNELVPYLDLPAIKVMLGSILYTRSLTPKPYPSGDAVLLRELYGRAMSNRVSFLIQEKFGKWPIRTQNRQRRYYPILRLLTISLGYLMREGHHPLPRRLDVAKFLRPLMYICIKMPETLPEPIEEEEHLPKTLQTSRRLMNAIMGRAMRLAHHLHSQQTEAMKKQTPATGSTRVANKPREAEARGEELPAQVGDWWPRSKNDSDPPMEEATSFMEEARPLTIEQEFIDLLSLFEPETLREWDYLLYIGRALTGSKWLEPLENRREKFAQQLPDNRLAQYAYVRTLDTMSIFQHCPFYRKGLELLHNKFFDVWLALEEFCHHFRSPNEPEYTLELMREIAHPPPPPTSPSSSTSDAFLLFLLGTTPDENYTPPPDKTGKPVKRHSSFIHGSWKKTNTSSNLLQVAQVLAADWSEPTS